MEPSKIIGSDSSGSCTTSSVTLSNHSTSGIDRRSKGLVVLLHGPKPALPLYHPSLSEHLLHAFVQLEVGVHLRGVAPCSTYPRKSANVEAHLLVGHLLVGLPGLVGVHNHALADHVHLEILPSLGRGRGEGPKTSSKSHPSFSKFLRDPMKGRSGIGGVPRGTRCILLAAGGVASGATATHLGCPFLFVVLLQVHAFPAAPRLHSPAALPLVAPVPHPLTSLWLAPTHHVLLRLNVKLLLEVALVQVLDNLFKTSTSNSAVTRLKSIK